MSPAKLISNCGSLAVFDGAVGDSTGDRADAEVALRCLQSPHNHCGPLQLHRGGARTARSREGPVALLQVGVLAFRTHEHGFCAC